MGRKSIKIERLPSDSQRARTYKKRGKGIVKKASEISVLCDIDVLLIMFSETGKLDYFSSNPSIGNTLQRFIQKATKLQADDQEINREVVDDDIEPMLLELQERMMDMEAFNSDEQFNQLIQGLQNVQLMVANREQMHMQMQQPKEEPEAGLMFDFQAGMHMPMQQPQDQGLEFTIEDLYPYMDMQWQTQMLQLQAVPENGTEEPLPSSFLSLLGYKPTMQAPPDDAAAPYFGVCGVQPQGDEHM